MFKRSALFIATVAAASGVNAAKFDFHGDFNNRFQVYTNQNNFYTYDNPAGGAKLGGNTPSGKASVEDSYGEIKYRLWSSASTDDGGAKAVYAVEIGGVRFGRSGTGRSQGGSFSGDGANVETRWAYTELKLPSNDAHSVRVGLQPYKINGFLWNETATGITLSGPLAEDMRYSAAWMRGKERRNTVESDNKEAVDGYSFRIDNSSIENTKLGAFVLYQTSDADVSDPTAYGDVTSAGYELKYFGDIDFEILSIGLEGSHSMPLDSGTAFVNWDVIYQNGSVDNADYISTEVGMGSTNSTSSMNNFDMSAYFVNLSLGLEQGNTKYSYTLWYASGDDNPNDGDMDAFLATDVDRTESIAFFEGGYTDDQAYSERSYLLDKGIIMNRFGIDHKCSSKLTMGGAAIHFLTAEDVKYTDDNGVGRSSTDVGIEFDAYAKYKLYPTMELALNVGYLVSDDAMDFYDVKRDGNADNDIIRSTARLRYKF